MNAHSPTTIAAPAASRPTVAHAIAHAKECFAACEAAGPGLCASEEASTDDRNSVEKANAFEEAQRSFRELVQTSDEAVIDLITAPMLSLDDVRAKAQCLSSFKGCFLDETAVNLLLTNMAEVAPVAPVEPDPLAELVESYRAGMASYNASVVEDMDDAEDDAFASKTWRPAYDRLCSQAPAATTLPGAVAAVRLAFDDMGQCADAGLQRALLLGALAYFDGAQA